MDESNTSSWERRDVHQFQPDREATHINHDRKASDRGHTVRCVTGDTHTMAQVRTSRDHLYEYTYTFSLDKTTPHTCFPNRPLFQKMIEGQRVSQRERQHLLAFYIRHVYVPRVMMCAIHIECTLVRTLTPDEAQQNRTYIDGVGY
jgi:hypothetical protein